MSSGGPAGGRGSGRILLLTETMPFPLDSGGRIKTYHTLRSLTSRYEVVCHALVRDRSQLRHASDLEPLCTRLVLHHVPRSLAQDLACVARSLVTGQPFLVRRHFHRHVLQALREEMRRHSFDAVYCDHLSMLEYGRRLGLPVVLDAHNVEFAIVRRHAETLRRSPVRLAAEWEWRSLRRYERRWYPACRLVLAVSAVDRDAIRALAGRELAVAVVPIAIDTRATPRRTEPAILWIGGLHWPPNADAVVFFIEQVLPLVRRRVPAATLTVVGKDPAHAARRAGRTDGVRFVGHVEDLRSHAAGSRVLVVPLRSGSGMRVKILDALARGVPIVTTTIGVEGIEAEHGVHVLIADTPEAFAEQVARVLQDVDLARRLAANGRRLVEERYDVARVGGTLRSTLRETIDEVACSTAG